MIGTTIAGRYEIQEQIGIGGMGVVYLAYDATLRREVAAKFIAPHLVQQAESRERFQREAHAVAGLTHPNIVAVYDFVEDPKTHGAVLIMELLRGASLRQRMADRNRPPFSDVAVQMCKALEAAHGKGILHRDIKPENIFVCTNGTLKLMDFGLARLLDSASTQSGTVVGTVSYMAPEQLRGEKLDVRTDLYALGVLLYEYLAGVTPFAADNPGAVLMKHLNEPPPSLREKLPTLPADIEAIVFKLLEKKPDDRYPTATALREALQNPSPSGNTTQVETANAAAALPTVVLPAPPPVFVPIEPLFPKPRSGSGKGPLVVTSQKKRSRVGLLSIPIILLASFGAAAYLNLGHNPVINVVRKPQEQKAAQHGLTTKPRHKKAEKTEHPTPDATAALSREVRQEEAALAKERQEAARLKQELAAKQESDPDVVTPGPDIPPPNTDGDNPTPARDAPPDAAGNDSHPAPPQNSVKPPALPASPALNVTGRAQYLPLLRTVRVRVQFNGDCNVRFYALQPGEGQAVIVAGSLTQLRATDMGGDVPIDLTLNDSASPPPRIVMVASRRDLTDLKPSYPVAAPGDAAHSLRQSVNAAIRSQRRQGRDTVVRLLPVLTAPWKKTN